MGCWGQQARGAGDRSPHGRRQAHTPARWASRAVTGVGQTRPLPPLWTHKRRHPGLFNPSHATVTSPFTAATYASSKANAAATRRPGRGDDADDGSLSLLPPPPSLLNSSLTSLSSSLEEGWELESSDTVCRDSGRFFEAPRDAIQARLKGPAACVQTLAAAGREASKPNTIA